MRMSRLRTDAWTRCRLLLSDACGLVAASGVSAQPADRSSDPRLVELARRDGALTLYASMAEKDLQRLVDAFTAKYGVAVSVWRAGKNKVLQRAIAETAAGRQTVDVVHNPSQQRGIAPPGRDSDVQRLRAVSAVLPRSVGLTDACARQQVGLYPIAVEERADA